MYGQNDCLQIIVRQNIFREKMYTKLLLAFALLAAVPYAQAR